MGRDALLGLGLGLGLGYGGRPHELATRARYLPISPYISPYISGPLSWRLGPGPHAARPAGPEQPGRCPPPGRRAW